MKRDWSIIRSILLLLEESATQEVCVVHISLPGFRSEDVAFNIELLLEANYIKGKVFRNSNGREYVNILVFSMTFTGYDLLDTLRNPISSKDLNAARIDSGFFRIEPDKPWPRI